MSEDNIEQALVEFKEHLAERYTKEELIDRIIGQFESTKIAMSILTILVSDGSTGSDRATARLQGREVLRIYNELMEE